MARCALLLVAGALLAVASPNAAAAESLRWLRKRKGQLVEQTFHADIEGEKHTLLFELFIPNSCTGTSGAPLCAKVPVLIFLHGRGESGGYDVTNAQSLPWLLLNNKTFADSFEFVAVIPQCPGYCAELNGWQPQVLRSVTALVQQHIVTDTIGGDPSRVYLAGQSMGGNGAWIYAAQQPRLFAAVAVVCGYAQESTPIARRLVSGQTAVLVCHSADDSVIPVGASDEMVQALTDRGQPAKLLKYVRYEHAPGPPMPEFAHLIGHGSYELIFRDPSLYSWLLHHRLPPNVAASEWRPLASAV